MGIKEMMGISKIRNGSSPISIISCHLPISFSYKAFRFTAS